jgi:hypothetical protein
MRHGYERVHTKAVTRSKNCSVNIINGLTHHDLFSTPSYHPLCAHQSQVSKADVRIFGVTKYHFNCKISRPKYTPGHHRYTQSGRRTQKNVPPCTPFFLQIRHINTTNTKQTNRNRIENRTQRPKKIHTLKSLDPVERSIREPIHDSLKRPIRVLKSGIMGPEVWQASIHLHPNHDAFIWMAFLIDCLYRSPDLV